MAVALLLAVAACGGASGGDDRAAPTTDRPRPFTYVAVGASESVGAGADDPATQAWTEVLRKELRPGATFVNVAVSGTTVELARRDQLARALEAKPALVTVWLAVNDAMRSVPAADYERDLRAIVHELRQGGAQVLLGNAAPVEDLPVVRACLPDPPPGRPCVLSTTPPPAAAIAAYVAQLDDAVARIAADEGAVLVDIHAVAVAARPRLDRYFSSDGFHPSTEGHAAIAHAFAAALRADPRTRQFARGG